MTVARYWVGFLGSAVFVACAAGEANSVDDLNPSDASADSRPAPKSDAAIKDSPVYNSDAAGDAKFSVDAASDAFVDPNDAPFDAGDAQAKDAGKDGAPDAAKDGAVDAAKDAAKDAPKDAVVDAAQDSGADAPLDAKADASTSSDGGGTGTLTCPNGACLLIGEVYEGASNDKALEIYNGCAASIDLTAVDVCVEFNASSYCKNGVGTGNTISLTGVLKPNETFVICHSAISATGACDKLDAKLSFNGNDRIALLRNNAIVDAFGELGKDPGDVWSEQDYRRTTCGAYLGTGAFSSTTYTGTTSGDLSDLGKGP